MTPATRKTLATCLAVPSLLSANVALAHGSMEVPLSRVYNCYKEGPENPQSAACKAAIQAYGTQAFYDWNGVRQGNANGQHRTLIPDGKLCSAANESHKGLDLARTDWKATQIAPNASGNFEFVFYATAVHATNYFQFYVTRPGYNPALPLKWSDLEAAPFCTVKSATAVNNRYRLSCPFPQGRTGSHVIYAIWQRSDSPEAFYACVDVKLGTTALAPTSSWKELGQVQARTDLPAGSTVTFRLFDSDGRDAETHPLLLDRAAPAADWLARLAERVNASSTHVRLGALQSSGEIAPIKDRQGNSVYGLDSGYTFQIDIQKPAADEASSK
ncbi:lytic polysaccharide monooxygenase [Archangium violaceum]|uniref:lytic polysaccharide monooxygenase n=1 Tax=Archangium violaceum TaxID=83451 RepID=UPI00194F960A|nr:lytic polysaccharide monooxygenase [Archangium violaceum]QRN93451.1 lytic polysaccharide monooxygenase [Archangium violaceum]